MLPAALGLAGIVAAIVVFDGQTSFPSLYVLLPVVGTGLAILFASGTGVGRLLAWKPFVGIGLISYSAYLWHQPLFAFARIRSVYEPSLWLMSGLSVLALVLAWGTWRFVERPFRGRPGIALDRGKRLDWRKAPSGVAYAAYDFDHVLRLNYGLGGECREFTEDPDCRTSDKPEMLLWGDSYAMHLVPALLASDPELAMMQQTKSGCAPIPGLSMLVPERSLSWAHECIGFNNVVLDELSNKSGIRYMVLSSRFRLLNEDVVTTEGSVAQEEFRARVLAVLRETVVHLCVLQVKNPSSSLPISRRDIISANACRQFRCSKMILSFVIFHAMTSVPTARRQTVFWRRCRTSYL